MEKVIAMLEDIIADLGFSGISCAGADIIPRLKEACSYCHELNMSLGENICMMLSESLSQGNTVSAAEYLCRLSCYVHCLIEFNSERL